jgi:hypothetical protein
MVEAVKQDEEDKFQGEFHLFGWQTAHLMNSSGNYKKRITLDALIGKPKEETDKSEDRLDRDEKNKQMTELKEKFGKKST